MLEVDISSLKNAIERLQKLLDEYEEIELNLFNQLKTSCTDWRDGNSEKFESEIYRDRKETDLLKLSLKERKNLYDFIYERYSAFGKKLKCNLNEKDTLLHTFDECYLHTNAIVAEFDRIDRSFYYSGRSSIEAARRKVVNVRTACKNFKTKAKEMFSEIEAIENKIEAKIKTLEEVKINEFDFDLP